MDSDKKSPEGCALAGLRRIGCTVAGLFLFGIAFAAVEPQVEVWWHQGKMRWRFSGQMASPGEYAAMPYGELEALLAPGFTVGDAYERFGKPRCASNPYQSGADLFLYDDIGFARSRGQGDGSGRVTCLQLVFTNFVLKEWWPMEIDGVGIRDGRGRWTDEGKELRAREKWPGSKRDEKHPLDE